MPSSILSKKQSHFRVRPHVAPEPSFGETVRNIKNAGSTVLVHEIECGEVIYNAAKIIARVGLVRYLEENPPTPPVLTAQATLNLQKK